METRKVRLKRRTPAQEPPNRAKAGWLFALLVVIAVVVFFMVINGFIAKEKEQLNNTADLESEGLYFALQMEKKSYKRGEPIKVQLSVRNITTSPITLDFTHELEFDFLVQREMNLLFAQVPMNVWRLTSAKHPQEDPHTITIPPGKMKIFSGEWDQTDAKGNLVDPGRYVITGFLNAKNRTETLQLRGKTN